MPADLFDRACRALWGDLYVALAAAAFQVDKNTIGKWRDAKSRIPPGVWNNITHLLVVRQGEAQRVLLEIGSSGFGSATISAGLLEMDDARRDRLQAELKEVCEALGIPPARLVINATGCEIEVAQSLGEYEVNTIMKWIRKHDQRLPIVLRGSSDRPTAAVKENTKMLEIISPGAGMADDVSLDVMGPGDFSEGAELNIRFTSGPAQTGRVIRLENSGAIAIVEVSGQRWYLKRRAVVMMGARRHPWSVGGLANEGAST